MEGVSLRALHAQKPCRSAMSCGGGAAVGEAECGVFAASLRRSMQGYSLYHVHEDSCCLSLRATTRLVLALMSLLNYRRFDVRPLMTRVCRRTDQDLRDLTGATDRNGWWWTAGAGDAHVSSSRRDTGLLGALCGVIKFAIMGYSASVKGRDKEDVVVRLQGV